MDVSFKGIKSVYDKVSKEFDGSKNLNSGIMDPKFEKMMKLASNYFEKNILSINSNQKMTRDEFLKSKGDISKINKDVFSTINECYKISKELTNKFKNNKNISENSILKIFNDNFEFLTNSKYIPFFNKAVDDYNKSLSKKDHDTILLLIILSIFIPFFALVGLILILIILTNDSRDENLNNISEEELENKLTSITLKNKTFISLVGFSSLRCISYIKSLGNPLQEYNKAKKAQEDTKKELLKSKEAYEFGLENSSPMGINKQYYGKIEPYYYPELEKMLDGFWEKEGGNLCSLIDYYKGSIETLFSKFKIARNNPLTKGALAHYVKLNGVTQVLNEKDKVSKVNITIPIKFTEEFVPLVTIYFIEDLKLKQYMVDTASIFAHNADFTLIYQYVLLERDLESKERQGLAPKSALIVNKLEEIVNFINTTKKPIKLSKQKFNNNSSDKSYFSSKVYSCTAISNNTEEQSKESFLDICRKNEVAVIDYSNDRRLGREEFITGLIIVAASLIGIWVLVNIIRFAIYWIGTVKIDIMQYISNENEYLKMNIEVLKLKKEKLTDPKQIKKIDKIIEKQQKWQNKFQKDIDDFERECIAAYGEANNQEEKENEIIDNTKEQDDNFDVIL
jgi:hypothetical protein